MPKPAKNRRVIVLVQQCLNIVFCLSVTLCPLSFLDKGEKPKRFHMYYCTILFLGSLWPLAVSATFTLVLDVLDEQTAKDDGYTRATLYM